MSLKLGDMPAQDTSAMGQTMAAPQVQPSAPIAARVGALENRVGELENRSALLERGMNAMITQINELREQLGLPGLDLSYYQ